MSTHPFDHASALLRSAITFLNEEHAAAPRVARLFASSAMEEWPALLTRVTLPYGVLDYLLDIAREELDRQPRRARYLTIIVLLHVRRVRVPRGAMLLQRSLHGRAWKENGNAHLELGRLSAAGRAAHRAVMILSKNTVLLNERAAATMLQARVAQEMQQPAAAVVLLRECNAVFQRLGDERRSLQAAMIEGSILYDSGDYAAARSAYLLTQATAERLNDARELARILNNLGECEIRLKNLDAALAYLRAALAAFERENMLGERQRVFWGMARLLRDHGRLNDAAAELLRVRTDFQERGMIIDAALAGLDLVELLAATDPAGVTAVCRELVTVFGTIGREQSMRVALAYLAEQARLNAPVDAPAAFQTELRYVRSYVKELAVAPDAAFAPPTPAPH